MEKIEEILSCNGEFTESLNRIKEDGLLSRFINLDYVDIMEYLAIDAVGGHDAIIAQVESYNKSYNDLQKKVKKLSSVLSFSQIWIAIGIGVIILIGLMMDIGLLAKGVIILSAIWGYNYHCRWVDIKVKSLDKYINEIEYNHEVIESMLKRADKYLEIRDRLYNLSN